MGQSRDCLFRRPLFGKTYLNHMNTRLLVQKVTRRHICILLAREMLPDSLSLLPPTLPHCISGLARRGCAGHDVPTRMKSRPCQEKLEQMDTGCPRCPTRMALPFGMLMPPLTYDCTPRSHRGSHDCKSLVATLSFGMS